MSNFNSNKLVELNKLIKNDSCIKYHNNKIYFNLCSYQSLVIAGCFMYNIRNVLYKEDYYLFNEKTMNNINSCINTYKSKVGNEAFFLLILNLEDNTKGIDEVARLWMYNSIESFYDDTDNLSYCSDIEYFTKKYINVFFNDNINCVTDEVTLHDIINKFGRLD